jgi:hypothetical protein
LLTSGRTQAGIRYLMSRWHDIPVDLQERFLQEDFPTLPPDIQESIQGILLVRSREEDIAQRTAVLRGQMREQRAQTVRVEAADARQNAAHSTRRNLWRGLATVVTLVSLGLFYAFRS